MTDSSNKNGLDTNGPVDEQRRSAMLNLAKAMAYVPPVVATFAMGGMSVREAHAYGGGQN